MRRTDAPSHRSSRIPQVDGHAVALAAWTVDRRDISGPEDGYEREEILNDLADFTHLAVNGPVVLLRTAQGRALIEPHDRFPEDLLTVTYTLHGVWGLRTFWMNRSSMVGLSERIRDAGDEVAADFASLLVSEEAPR